ANGSHVPKPCTQGEGNVLEKFTAIPIHDQVASVSHTRRTGRAPGIQSTHPMTSPTSEIRAQPSTPFFTLSGTLLPFLLLALSLLVSPRFLEHHISLEWRLGNIRGPAYVLQALLVGAAAASMLFRRGIGARLAT